MAESRPLSVPQQTRLPRPLTDDESKTLRRVAGVLIPAGPLGPAAADEPGIDPQLGVALHARGDAFESTVKFLARARDLDDATLRVVLERWHTECPDDFQALSAICAGAWLLTDGVRQRIGYHGLERKPAGLEEAADQIMDGILDPVLSMADEQPARWAR